MASRISGVIPISLPRLIAAGLGLSLLSGCANQDLDSVWTPMKDSLTAFDQTMRSILPPPAPPPENDGEGLPKETARPTAKAAATAGAPTAKPAADASVQPPAQRQAALPGARPNLPALRATSELVGLDSRDIEERLGTPAMRRRDAPAELWQYRSPVCVMDLFLYSQGGAFRVTHVDLRSRSVEPVQTPRCLASFGEHRPPPTSG